MKSENQMVSGFIGEDNEVLNPTFQYKRASFKRRKNKYSLKDLMLKETQF
jgi:hypothetical protein